MLGARPRLSVRHDAFDLLSRWERCEGGAVGCPRHRVGEPGLCPWEDPRYFWQSSRRASSLSCWGNSVQFLDRGDVLTL